MGKWVVPLSQQGDPDGVLPEGQDIAEDASRHGAAPFRAQRAAREMRGGADGYLSVVMAPVPTVAPVTEPIADEALPPAPEGVADEHEPAEKLPAIIEWVIASYYAKDYEPFFSRITEDCSFIGAGNMMYFSRKEMLDVLEADEMAPHLLMRNTRFSILGDPAFRGERAIVFGTYDLFSGLKEKMLLAAQQRITVCCRLTDEGWKACHIHSSNEWRELVDEDTFPIQVSMDTYRYVQSILRTGRQVGGAARAVLREAGGSSRVVAPDAILYIEAAGRRSIVHELNGSYELNLLLGDAERQLGDAFVRVHRGYLVNIAHVRALRRGEVELDGGVAVPVPERRHAAVRLEIERRLGGDAQA